MLGYVICRNKKEAEKISRALIEKRLIACANTFSVRSIYRWKTKIVKSNETAMIVKTNKKNFKKLVKETKKIHSYKIPCIIKINSQANTDFDEWAESCM